MTPRALPGAPSSPPSDAGVDAVDCAMDALSRQHPAATLGSVVEALRHTDRDTRLEPDRRARDLGLLGASPRPICWPLRQASQAPASEVYLHEMPGGQFTNLKAQARSLGLEERWPRGRQDLCGREPDVRRYRQSHAKLQGCRRHGA